MLAKSSRQRQKGTGEATPHPEYSAMKQIFTIILISYFCVVAGHSEACNCEDEYSFEEEFENSQKIFSGTVVEIVHAKEEFWPPWMNNTFIKVTIRVDQYWKGTLHEKETIEWNYYCRYHLRKGDKFLFFVNSGFPYGRAGCGLSDRFDRSQEIIEKLGAGSTNFSHDWTVFFVCLLLLLLLVFSGRLIAKYLKWQIDLENTAYKLAVEIRDGNWEHLEYIKSEAASECDEIIIELKKRCPGHTVGAYKRGILIGLKMTESDN